MKTALDKAREAPKSTKARLLSAAEEVFAAKGFQGASTREIAARAGVNISSLHYHWESKERLYFAVFRNIYDQIVGLLQNTLAPLLSEHTDPQKIIDITVGQLFDFFAASPNIPKLLLRRVVENEEVEVGIERDVLQPAWTEFSAWLARLGRHLSDTDSRLFMLSVQTVLLVYLLDASSYRNLLGGSVREEPLRTQVREHVLKLVRQLLV